MAVHATHLRQYSLGVPKSSITNTLSRGTCSVVHGCRWPHEQVMQTLHSEPQRPSSAFRQAAKGQRLESTWPVGAEETKGSVEPELGRIQKLRVALPATGWKPGRAHSVHGQGGR